MEPSLQPPAIRPANRLESFPPALWLQNLLDSRPCPPENTVTGGIIMRTRILAAAVLLAALLTSQASALDWPFRIEAGDTLITIYMPQIETFEGDMVTARAAISIFVPGMETPVFGAIWFRSYALTDRETRTVVLSDVDVMSARFPSLDGKGLARFSGLAETEIEDWEFLMTLDDMKAAIENVDRRNIAAEGIRNDPPKIYFRSAPEVLVTIDGEPKEQDLEGTDLKYIVNTAFFIVYDKKSRNYYLRGGPWWYSSKKADSGFAPVGRVPDEVAELKEETDKAAAAAAAKAEAAGDEVPADPDSAFAGQSPPGVIVTTVPAELIVSDGEPDFTPVEGTDLLYMTNTDSDVFIDTKGQQYFTLISGRWYTAPSMEGGWKYVASEDLPVDFAKIPPESDNGHVLASVAGTEQARDAVLDMYVPQTAEVSRKEAAVTVEYDGEPRFERIEDTDMTYAVNTSSAVILFGRNYYCCDEAVWFTAPAPTGPWVVCIDVPGLIYTIPPSCPLYNVVYVRVYDHTPDVVYVGYTPGYTCSYVYGGTVVYGTGYYYRPWYGRYYYPRPVTWGYGVHWNPYTGWGFSFGEMYGGPYGWFRMGWGSPYQYWGPRGYWGGYNRGYRHGYYHGALRGYATGHRAGQHYAPSPNLYKNRSTGVKRTGEVRTAKKKPAGSPSTMERRRPAGTAMTKERAPAAGQARDNIYVDKKGNVYRDNQGRWEKQTGTRDKSAGQPGRTSKKELNAYKNARDRAARINEQYQRQQSSSQRDKKQQPIQRDAGKKSTGRGDTSQSTPNQSKPKPATSGQRNTRSSGKRRTSGSGKEKKK
jgi:hypothetical protein